MKKLVKVSTSKVFTDHDFYTGDRRKEVAVDKFLEIVKREMLAGRLGEIKESVDFIGSTNVSVSLEGYRQSLEDAIISVLNSSESSLEAILDLGAQEVSMIAMPETAADKKKIRVKMPDGETMVFYFNGNKWRQKISF